MWNDNLKQMKAKSGLTTKEIAAQSTVPEPTLEKLFAGSTQDPKLMTVWNVVHALGYTLNDLDDTCADKKTATSLSDEALQLAEDYEGLDNHGQRVVRLVADEEKARLDGAKRPAAKKPTPPPVEVAGPAVEPELSNVKFAAYGDAKKVLTTDDLNDIKAAVTAKEERNRKKKSGE